MKPFNFLFIALVAILCSCEQESVTTQESEVLNFNSEITNTTRANIKRTRLKQRSNGFYKTVVVVEDDPNNEIATIELSIPPQNGVEAYPSTMILLPKATNANGNTRYIFKELSIEGEDPVGQSFAVIITQKNDAGENVGEPETNYVTAQDNDAINMSTPILKVNEDGETFSFKIAVTGNNAQEVANVNVMLTPDDGGSEADPEEFGLELIRENETKKVFTNQNIEFIESGNVIDMEYIATVTLLDTNGEELDYVEFRIVGLED